MTKSTQNCVYLDNQASTPIDPSVASVITSLLADAYGNPHSEHSIGWQAAEHIDTARENIASLIGSDPNEIVFTSGATESNNHVIQGLLRTTSEKHPHVITSAIEHKSILEPLTKMQKQAPMLDIVPVSNDGMVDPDLVSKYLRKNTVLVTIGMANNEIGTIQPIAEIAEICHSQNVTFHTDAAQAVGKVPVDVVDSDIDLLSLSGHKIYGPKGIGALYISKSSPTRPAPLILGGSQQNHMRAGTVPTFLCAGLGEACRIAKQRLKIDEKHSIALRALFLEILSQSIPDLKVNGPQERRLPGNLNVYLPNIEAENLLATLQGKIAASTGSACNSGIVESSHVLKAIGLSTEVMTSCIRFGIGRFTSKADIQLAADLIAKKVSHLRDL